MTEQRYNWNEHRYDDPFKTGLWITGLLFTFYAVALVIYLWSGSPLYPPGNGLIAILFSYPVIAYILIPIGYHRFKRLGFWRFEGGAVTIAFVMIFFIFVILVVLAIYGIMFSIAGSGGQVILPLL